MIQVPFPLSTQYYNFPTDAIDNFVYDYVDDKNDTVMPMTAILAIHEKPLYNETTKYDLV